MRILLKPLNFGSDVTWLYYNIPIYFTFKILQLKENILGSCLILLQHARKSGLSALRIGGQ